MFRMILACALIGSWTWVASAADEKPKETKPRAKPQATSKTATDKPATTTSKTATAKKPSPTATKVPATKKRKPTKVAKEPPVPPFTPGGKYREGDMARPRPVVVVPPTSSTQQCIGLPPSDAIVLFDGSNFSHWIREPRRVGDTLGPDDTKPRWIIRNGYMECKPMTGDLGTRDAFGDCQLHIEWAAPAVVSGFGQGRGNSGILLHGLGEVQVLDSYGDNDTYPDGQAAAIYHTYPPLVNASRRPGEWQTYDILVQLAKVDAKTQQVIRPARITVLHNGVAVQIAAELESKQDSFKFALQDHRNSIRYRNIWVRPLKDYDAE